MKERPGILSRPRLALELFIWTLFVLPGLVLSRNVSIPTTSPDISYSPFLCNVTVPDCSGDGGWRAIQGADGSTVVSTNGPSEGGANLVPQMFLEFRARSIFITLSPSSNALMNVTIITGQTILSRAGNSSIGSFAVFNLDETNSTTLSITFLNSAGSNQLGIGSITVDVSDVSESGSIAPTQTLPPTVSLPTTFGVPPTTATTTSTTVISGTSSPTSTSQGEGEGKKQLIRYAVGLTIGLGLGLTAVVSGAYIIWRWRQRRRAENGIDNIQLHSEQRNKDNMDTRWF
ncbi:hypothetical protein VNI00_010621 [Paramarasmius palmivorus]|uniref:Uncharacterized protein n=1 Tax=Paramarasmius palmivorus TaxID=297713 RepID=A0AAW0CIQ3_9AGAR